MNQQEHEPMTEPRELEQLPQNADGSVPVGAASPWDLKIHGRALRTNVAPEEIGNFDLTGGPCDGLTLFIPDPRQNEKLVLIEKDGARRRAVYLCDDQPHVPGKPRNARFIAYSILQSTTFEQGRPFTSEPYDLELQMLGEEIVAEGNPAAQWGGTEYWVPLDKRGVEWFKFLGLIMRPLEGHHPPAEAEQHRETPDDEIPDATDGLNARKAW